MIGIIALIFVIIIGAIVYAGFKSSKIEAEKRKENKEFKEALQATRKDFSAEAVANSQKETVSRFADGKADGPKLSPEQEKILKVSRQLLLDERLLMGKVKNEEIKKALAPSLDKADEILKVLRKQPDEIQNAKQFVNYYIPTLDVILSKYIKLEETGIDISAETEKVVSYLSDINKALSKQYDNLFSNEKMDLSVEMEAMSLAFKRDGLIDSAEYKSVEPSKQIELTL